MEIRYKTITFQFRHFEIGETVRGFLNPPSRINNQTEYVVKKYIEPEDSHECGTIIVEGISEEFPDWHFEPLNKPRKV